jgi:hypothetical protein
MMFSKQKHESSISFRLSWNRTRPAIGQWAREDLLTRLCTSHCLCLNRADYYWRYSFSGVDVQGQTPGLELGTGYRLQRPRTLRRNVPAQVRNAFRCHPYRRMSLDE